MGRTGYLGTTEARLTYSDLVDAQGLGTLSAGADFELDVLAFVEAAVALAFDVGVVDEDVFAMGHLAVQDDLHLVVRVGVRSSIRRPRCEPGRR